MYKKNNRYKISSPDGYVDFDGINTVDKDQYIKIKTINNELTCSLNHRIYINDNDVIEANNISLGDYIKTSSGIEKVIHKEISNNNIILYDPINVNNNGSSYYSNNILSHNCEFLGSTNTVISTEVIRNLFSLVKEPKYSELNDKLRIFEKPIEGARYVIGCLPPNEKIRTTCGLKSIIDVNINDILYDENGCETKIKNIQIYKDFDGETYDIYTYGDISSTKFTDEHPILISSQPREMKRMRNHKVRGNDFKYIKSKDVRIDDWACFPNIYKTNRLTNNTLDEKWNKYKDMGRVDFEINDNPLKDVDFWWFIGMWLGDGWIQNRNNSYTIHTCHDANKEQHFAYKVKNIIEKYNRKVLINEEVTINTVFSSKQIHHFLQDTFGEYSHEKHISEWVKYLPIEYKLELLRGYIDSDGCIYFNKHNQASIEIGSVSLKLLEDIKDILYSLDYISVLRKETQHNICNTYHLTLPNYDSVYLLKQLNYKDFDLTKLNSVKNRNKGYSYFSDDKTKIYIKIKDVKKSRYCGDVYNFETENHTFLCNGLSTHNCDPSKGTGEDFSVAQILKFDSMTPLIFTQVAVFEDNFADVYSFSDIINKLSLYYNNAYLMVENNGEGAAVVNKLWWDIETENLVNTGSKAANLGIRATRSTKPKAVLLMKKLIEDGCLNIRDRRTVEEISSFIESNGRYFGKDLHDDLISGLYWAVYITQMNIFDEEIKLHSSLDNIKKDDNKDDEIWGIISDMETPENDFSDFYRIQ